MFNWKTHYKSAMFNSYVSLPKGNDVTGLDPGGGDTTETTAPQGGSFDEVLQNVTWRAALMGQSEWI